MKLADRYDNIIWDWNGTLINDMWLCVEVVNKILTNHNGLQLDVPKYKEVFGFPIVDYYKKIGIDLNKESFEALTDKFIPGYEAKIKTCELHTGVKEILNSFNLNKVNQYILTAGHKESVIELLEHYAIRNYFKEVEGLDNHRAESKETKGKQLIKRNHIDKSKTVLIGDTIHDYEVANSIGVDCVLIANGHQSKKRLIKKTKNKILILNSLEELLY